MDRPLFEGSPTRCGRKTRAGSAPRDKITLAASIAEIPPCSFRQRTASAHAFSNSVTIEDTGSDLRFAEGQRSSAREQSWCAVAPEEWTIGWPGLFFKWLRTSGPSL